MIHVRAGDAVGLQAAINVSAPGDEIVLPAGAKYVGTFTLPPKTGNVTLRGAIQVVGRVVVSSAPLMPTIASGSSGRAIEGTGAKNWTLHGIRFEPNVGGFGEVLGFEGAENITLDCLLLVVPTGQQQKRGILGNGVHIKLLRSHLAGIWRTGQDSQAIAFWDGAGPYDILDNFLEAASENILAGGSDTSSAANIPADIRIEGNTLSKNLAWKGQPRQVKNLLELKCAKRVIIRGNLLENNWADAQSGFAVLFTPRNQDGSAPFTVIEDVLFERNTLWNVARGFNLTGYDDLNTSGKTTRIVIRDNTIDTPGIGALLHNGLGEVAIYRNDFGPTTDRAILSLDDGASTWAVETLTWADNKGGGYIHSSDFTGKEALQEHARIYSLGLPTEPFPSTPEVVDGPPSPLPGTVIEPPSVPIVDDPLDGIRRELDAVRWELLSADTALVALRDEYDRLVAYLQATPKVSRIEQLRAYIKGVGR